MLEAAGALFLLLLWGREVGMPWGCLLGVLSAAAATVTRPLGLGGASQGSKRAPSAATCGTVRDGTGTRVSFAWLLAWGLKL